MKHERAGLNHCGDPKAFIEYSDDMDEYNKLLMSRIHTKSANYWSYLMIWLKICIAIKI